MKERSNWIIREGSGHNYVEYVLILCCVSIVAAMIFGAIGGELEGLYLGFKFPIL